ncbi:MAG: SRPBCC domain-containing protein, partial [Anaerolineales bacterium]
IYLWWGDGYAVVGAFSKFEPGQKRVGTWRGSPDPGETQVQVTFKEKSGRTLVTVLHRGFGSGRAWRECRSGFENAWPASLENLQSILETGVDLRFARRPRLGINFGDFNAEIAKKLGVPAKAGIRLEGTAENTGARAAGLQKDDVLVALNGHKLADFGAFGPALRGLKAGDKPKVVFYRGAKKHTTPLELSSWPISTVAATAQELAAAVRPMHAEVREHLAQAVQGLSEEQAARRPSENEWSAKELIAHFILSERDYQGWLADMLNDVVIEDWLQMQPNVHERVRATVSRFGGVDALLQELRLAGEETASLLENLPASFIQNRKHLYRRAALWLTEGLLTHWTDEHGEQMRQTVAAAK